jgi:asparagine synthase (glutamine-hydrolysing)
MCGIYSAFSYDPSHTLDEQTHVKSFNTIKHRGPDSSTLTLINNRVCFGFHRLAINGLTPDSDQPFNISGIHLICNGEIFNYKHLIKKHELPVQTTSDCEVIVHLYLKYGMPKTITLLNGEFAFCLYDEPNGQLYAVRDHIGIRPLFIGSFEREDGVCFASEAKALVGHCTDINQYPPGHFTTYDLSHKTYVTNQWYFHSTMNLTHDAVSQAPELTRDEILMLTKKIFTDSVCLRGHTSERPVGTFLSGGLDSSLVTAILAQNNKDMHCFTIGMEGSLDVKAAIKVAKHIGLTNHHVVTVTLTESLFAIREVIKTLETYDITTIRASTFQWMLSKYISENTDVKVLLSGEVPDESVPGYLAFAFCESDDAFVQMSQTMIQELHQYDLLRTDRTTAQFGLEVRVPFADQGLLNLFHNIDVKYRRFDKDTMEKSLLRDAFKDDNLLPDTILYRKKHAFSDAVDGDTVCFHKEVERHAAKLITKHEWDNRASLYPVNTPVSKESFYYSKVFEYYPGQSQLLGHFWMPGVTGNDGKEIVNPSATALPGFTVDTEF